MSQLSKELMVSNGNVTGVIDRLEKTRFVKRVRAEHDRRIQFIELTAKGRKEFNRMAGWHLGSVEASQDRGGRDNDLDRHRRYLVCSLYQQSLFYTDFFDCRSLQFPSGPGRSRISAILFLEII